MQRVRAQIGLTKRVEEKWDGTDVCVAILDTGIIRHPDFDDRIIVFEDFVNDRNGQECYDDSGHGTHVAGCLCGSGKVSGGKYKGVAPKCKIVVGKVLDESGDGTVKSMIEGIEWVLSIKRQYQIRILNISVGVGKIENEEYRQKLVKAIEGAWDLGLVVVIAAGNNGPMPMSISPIATSGKIITVGCHDGDYKSEHLCENYSGRGPTKYEIKKPDIVAPGTDIVSCSNRIRRNGRNYMNAYGKKSGTSMATPLISGAAALLLQAEASLSNKEVKQKIITSARDLKESWTKQGWGMLDIDSLL